MKLFSAWLFLLAGTAVSLVANVEHMTGPPVAKVLGASVPVLMAGGVHLSGMVRNRYAMGVAWTAVALAFFVSYQSSYFLVQGWGMTGFQAALFPLVPETVMIVALMAIAETVDDRRAARQADALERQRQASNRQALDAIRQTPSVTVKASAPTVSEPSDGDEKRRAVVNRVEAKRQEGIREMANHWPGLSFLDIPEADRKKTVRRTLGSGPEKAERLVRQYLEHLENTLTTETQES